MRDISDLTGFPEMLDGRVKTLHPKVHGGILHIRGNKEHVAAVREHGIEPIDMVAVNLYAFEKTANKPGVAFSEIIENIDIGGPSMVRSAAKNFEDVAIVTSVADYAPVAEELAANGGSLARATRWRLAKAAFAVTAAYDAGIAGRQRLFRSRRRRRRRQRRHHHHPTDDEAAARARHRVNAVHVDGARAKKKPLHPPRHLPITCPLASHCLEAELFSQDPNPESLIPMLATLGLHYQRLSRQFQRTLEALRDIQADRAERERRDLKDAAALLELHKHKGVPWEPSDHGFVFSKSHVERFSQRLILLNESRHIEHVRFYLPPRTNNQ